MGVINNQSNKTENKEDMIFTGRFNVEVYRINSFSLLIHQIGNLYPDSAC